MNTNSRKVISLERLPDGAAPVQTGSVVRMYGVDHLDRFGMLHCYPAHEAMRRSQVAPHAGRQESFAKA